MSLERLQLLGPEPLCRRLPVGRLALPPVSGEGGGGGGGGGVGGLQHGLQDASSGIDEPVVDLQEGEARLARDLSLLVLRRVGMLRGGGRRKLLQPHCGGVIFTTTTKEGRRAVVASIKISLERNASLFVPLRITGP